MGSRDWVNMAQGFSFGRNVIMYEKLGTPRARVQAFYGWWFAMGMSVSAYKVALLQLRDFAQELNASGRRLEGCAEIDTHEIINALDVEILFWSDASEKR